MNIMDDALTARIRKLKEYMQGAMAGHAGDLGAMLSELEDREFMLQLVDKALNVKPLYFAPSSPPAQLTPLVYRTGVTYEGAMQNCISCGHRPVMKPQTLCPSCRGETTA